MTTIKEQLQADLTTNLKARNELETTTLRNLLGAIQTQEKSGKTSVEFTDEKVLTLIGQEVKKRRDTAVVYEEAGKVDRAARELAEVEVLAKYLPAQLTEEEIEAIVNTEIAEFSKLAEPTMKNFGLVMKAVTLQTKGKADGKVVSALVKSKLS